MKIDRTTFDSMDEKDVTINCDGGSWGYTVDYNYLSSLPHLLIGE